MLATSCLSEDHNLAPVQEHGSAQKGKIVLNLNTETQFTEQTRALDENAYRNKANYTVELWKNGEKVGNWTGEQTSLSLESEIGTYTVKAYYGTERPYSQDEFYVYGENTFTLAANEEKPVTVNCSPTCGKLRVEFDSKMGDYFSDYSVTYEGAEAMGTNKITWPKTEQNPWYVLLKQSGEEITYTVNVTKKSEYAYSGSTTGTATAKFTLKRNCGYCLKVAPNYVPNENGEFTLTITIDEGTNDKPVSITVPVSWI